MNIYKYNAFISYSHVDRDVADALKRDLERFAKPWYRWKALNIFQDTSNLASTPNLWLQTARAIDDSEYFILVASPTAAASPWINEELEQWLNKHTPDKLLIVLTDGDVQWSQTDGDFNWHETTAIPQTLKGKFTFEPKLIDLRHRPVPLFKVSDVLPIAAVLLNIEPTSLTDENVVQHRRSISIFGMPFQWIRHAWRVICRTGRTSSEEDVLTHDVALGVSAPRSAHPGDQFTASFVAYLEMDKEDVDGQLEALSHRAERHLGLQICKWRPGTYICVRAEGHHLNIQPREFRFVWQGHRILHNFDVDIESDAPESTTVLKFDVLIAEIVVARLRIDLEITSRLSATEMQSIKQYPIRSAFASYASSDRLRVLDRVTEIQRSGVDVFLDCLSLHPGDDWKPKLAHEIRDRDTLLLFWSIHAKESQWVDWEWRTALKLKGIDGIEPHPLDPVNEAAPPDELSDLQFNDRYMLTRQYYEMSKLL